MKQNNSLTAVNFGGQAIIVSGYLTGNISNN
jgi:hypothetical protein